jgi:hypothetical protein
MVYRMPETQEMKAFTAAVQEITGWKKPLPFTREYRQTMVMFRNPRLSYYMGSFRLSPGDRPITEDQINHIMAVYILLFQ